MYMQSKEKTIPLLMYHSISSVSTAKFRPFTVSPASFAEQMGYLQQQGYTPITVTHLVEIRSATGPALPERPVVLTFDDGFADFFTEALPVLRQYGFTATLYVATAFVEGTSRWLHREGETRRPMLTWQQLREIQQFGIECGGHTHNHPQLDTLPLSVARDEITRCKDLLEQHLEQQVKSFCYPFGYYTPAVRQLVREAGYTSACAVKHAMSSDRTDAFALTRFMVASDTDIETFAQILSGTAISPVAAIYLSARTYVWQAMRRSVAQIARPLQGRTL